jgi:hypothetical protein
MLLQQMRGKVHLRARGAWPGHSRAAWKDYEKSHRFIALPFEALNDRVFAFARCAKRPNVSFGSQASITA